MPVNNSCVTLDGPWEHRLVQANGAQFHLACAGEHVEGQPLILFLHGSPEYWWAWRDYLPALAEQGWNACAMDMRGAGGSDKTRNTDDSTTLAQDVIGVVRALGATGAVLVGQGRGGSIAWAAAAMEPQLIRGLVTISAPHPAHMFRLGFHITFRAWRHTAIMTMPRKGEPEWAREEDIRSLLTDFSAPGNDGASSQAGLYAAALALPNAAKAQLDQMRWSWRSIYRPSGRAFLEAASAPIRQPVLTIRGQLDPILPDRTWARTAEIAQGPYEHVVLPHAGHFVHEETPDQVLRVLTKYLEQFRAS